MPFPSLTSDQVDVWHTDLVSEGSLRPLLELLDEGERARADRFKVEHAYRTFVISHAFAREVLGQYLGQGPHLLSFRNSAHGKPDLEDGGDLRFNLSHTEGSAVLAAVRGREIGVDVERVRHNIDIIELADRFFSQPEAAWLRSQPVSERHSAFFACWTAKEAYIKAHGEGLSFPLSAFSVIPRHHGSGAQLEPLQLNVLSEAKDSATWSMWQVGLSPELRAALAVEGNSCQVRVARWPPRNGE